MVKTLCDICGEEINEDYIRSHYSYNLDFEGQKPHQTLRYRQDCNGATYGATLLKTLAYFTSYTDPKSWHLNLCGSCGSEFEKMIGDGIERLRNAHKETDIEKPTETLIKYNGAIRIYSVGNDGEVNDED